MVGNALDLLCQLLYNRRVNAVGRLANHGLAAELQENPSETFALHGPSPSQFRLPIAQRRLQSRALAAR
jgi:hypothetical protein